MRLSSESRRARWVILSIAWALVAWLAVRDALAVRDYVSLLDDSGTLAADSLPLHRTLPAAYADARTWVRYALAIDEGSGWQLRSTHDDNAPHGREVHWNSAFAHLIAFAGRARRAQTGEPIGVATEQVLAWFNLPLFIAVVIIFSSWVARRAGAAAGVLLAFGMLGSRWFYDGFAPNYVDHHGLLTAASFGVSLGALFMGGGWWRAADTRASLLPNTRRAARAGAIASASAGAFGMWISAASVIPTIAIVGLAGILATIWLAKRAHAEGAEYDGSLWRLWGRVGCVGSLAAYLIEYAPHHFGMRLEVNHPLYALAWLGGGELIAAIGEMRVSNRRTPSWHIIAAAVAVMGPALVILAAGPAAVFIPGVSRMARLHRHIEEFLSLPAVIQTHGPEFGTRFVAGFVLLIPGFLLLRSRTRDRVVITFAAITAVCYVILACWQSRWWLGASGPELTLLLVGVAAVVAERGDRVRWSVVAGLSAVFLVQSEARIRLTRSNVANGAVTIGDAIQPLYRDIAATFRASQPTGDIVVLASPSASTGIGYFGRFKTLGTLYWENLEGLDAAAAIFTARTDDEARALMRARGVTHVAVISKDDFLDAYAELAGTRQRNEALDGTFWYRLEHGVFPPWLRPIPLRVRARAVAPDLIVYALRVVPDQTRFEAVWNSAVAEAAAGDADGAERAFRSAIALIPSARAADLFANAGTEAYRWSAHRLAVRLLREALSLDQNTPSRVSLAWILATSMDDGVRDGRAAMTLVEPIALRSPNDPTVVDVYAAALAESGDFTNAARIEERLLNDARANGNVGAETRASERLARYRARHAWRQ